MAATTQYQIKQNMEEYREFLDDLSSWQKDLKKKDAAAKVEGGIVPQAAAARPGPPVRGCAKVSSDSAPDASGFRKHSSVPASNTKHAADKPERIKSSDYGAWDKFDVDKAIVEIEQESRFGSEDLRRIRERYDWSKQQKKQEVDTERALTALLEKEKGNGYFKRANYLKAVTHYKRSMEADPLNPDTPCNRAMAYLKLRKWIEAEDDCTTALTLKPKNVKALWRRGIARRQAGKLDLAQNDLKMALILDPGNKAITEELEKVTAPPKSPPLPSRRVPIEEVDTDSEAETLAEEERRWGKKASQGLRKDVPAAPPPAPKQRPLNSPSRDDSNQILTRSSAESSFDMKPISTRRLAT